MLNLENEITIVKSNTTVDYNKMTIKEIKELLENKGKTSLPSRAKKSDLIEMLNNEESEEESSDILTDDAVNGDLIDVIGEVKESMEVSDDLLMKTNKMLFNKNLDISNVEN